MPFIASMGIYVISKNVMLDLLRDQFPGANDFGSEVIPGATSIGKRVCVLSSCSISRNFDFFLKPHYDKGQCLYLEFPTVELYNLAIKHS